MARSVLPYSIHKVLVNSLVFTAFLLDFFGQFPGVGRRHYTGIYGNDLAPLHPIHGPFLDGRNILDALLKELPVGVELLFSLVEISTVGGQGSLIVRNDCIARRASEAADIC